MNASTWAVVKKEARVSAFSGLAGDFMGAQNVTAIPLTVL